MFPSAGARIPEAVSIAEIKPVTVVFPLVPVTATVGRSISRQANSTSLITSVPASSASVIGADLSPNPGEATTRSIPSSTSGSQAPVTLAKSRSDTGLAS